MIKKSIKVNLNRESDLENESSLLHNLGSKLDNIMITGKAGVGKSFLANSFADKYGIKEVIYDGSASYQSDIKRELSLVKDEILKRKSQENKSHPDKIFIIDDVSADDSFSEVLSNNSDLSWILNNSKDVNIFIILVTQEKADLQNIFKNVLDNLTEVNLTSH